MLDAEQAKQWLDAHKCGCEICTHTATMCPATASSIAMEYVQLKRDNHNLKMDVAQMQLRINLMETRQNERGVPWKDAREAYDKGVINGHIGAMSRR